VVICLERGADLHMSQLMPLPPTVSCCSKIQIDCTFLVPAHLGSPGKGPLNGYVCGPDAAAVASLVDQAKGQARVCRPPPLHFSPPLAPLGATENARHENTRRSKMQDLKMRDMNLRHQFARVEIAGHENAGPICKCGKS